MGNEIILPKNICEKFNKPYASEEDREDRFAKLVISEIKNLSEEVWDYQKAFYYIPIDELLYGTSLDDIRFTNTTDYLTLFEDAANFDFEMLLFYFSIILEASNSYEYYYNDNVLSTLENMLKSFNLLNLNYSYNKATKTFNRKIDKDTEQIIKINSANIKQKETKENWLQYSQSVDNFLLIKGKVSQEDLLDNLVRLKGVFERTVANKWPGTRIGNKKEILDKLFNKHGGDINTQTNSLAFIIKNIHHSQKNKNGKTTPYKFTKKEYVYWWLELNKLIYLVSEI
jgi:hypothetical protein